MELGLRNKGAVVLASTSGLGLAVAEELLAEGARVAICGRDPGRLGAALERLERAHGGRVLGQALDVRDERELGRHVERARARFGGVEILVLNAGGPPPGAAAGVADADLALAFELTFLSAVRAVRAVLPHMRSRRWGRIVALTSRSVREPIADLATSNSMRAALTGYLKTLAAEVAPDGVLVNSVCTGSFATERLESLIRARAATRGAAIDDERARWIGAVPLGRLGEPRELAALVAFLCSERASFVAGAAVACDGGATRGLL
jgi:3-oxoacyl-[acyl-carrier protein] reductase